MSSGWASRITGPLGAAAFLFVTTYHNSWGHIIHTENLVSIHLVILALAPFAAGRDRRWVVDAMAVATVATYVLAGVAKLRISGGAWLDGEVLGNQIAFDNARKALVGDVSSPFAPWILGWRWLLVAAAVGTVVVELGAPVALWRPRAALVWCAAAAAFHLGVVVFMAILFPYQLFGLAYAPLLPVERLGATVRRWRSRSRPMSPTSTPTG